MLVCIWAEAHDGLIGRNGTLPWSLPNDLKFFKKHTLGKTIVMGRKTFDGMGKRLLPQRHTIVLTRDSQYDTAGAERCIDREEVVARSLQEDIYVIGGAEVFAFFAPIADRLLVTRIDATFEGDTYMPHIPYEQFVLTHEEAGLCDEHNHHPHTFYFYDKKGM